MTNQEIEDLKTKLRAEHPGKELSLFRIGDFAIVLTNPRAADYDAWIDEGKTSAGLRAMVKNSTVWNADQLDAMLERYPAILFDDLAGELMRMGGHRQASVTPF